MTLGFLVTNAFLTQSLSFNGWPSLGKNRRYSLQPNFVFDSSLGYTMYPLCLGTFFNKFKWNPLQFQVVCVYLGLASLTVWQKMTKDVCLWLGLCAWTDSWWRLTFCQHLQKHTQKQKAHKDTRRHETQNRKDRNRAQRARYWNTDRGEQTGLFECRENVDWKEEDTER